jgi:hypothetical protein
VFPLFCPPHARADVRSAVIPLSQQHPHPFPVSQSAQLIHLIHLVFQFPFPFMISPFLPVYTDSGKKSVSLG